MAASWPDRRLLVGKVREDSGKFGGPCLVGHGLRLSSEGDGELLVTFKQRGGLIKLEAKWNRSVGWGEVRSLMGGEATAGLKVVQCTWQF